MLRRQMVSDRYCISYVCFSDLIMSIYIFIFFFFQAEDGIRDLIVTGVQTCALPILVKSILMTKGRLSTTRSARYAKSPDETLNYQFCPARQNISKNPRPPKLDRTLDRKSVV